MQQIQCVEIECYPVKNDPEGRLHVKATTVSGSVYEDDYTELQARRFVIDQSPKGSFFR